jgi:hypothetical protein
MIHSAYFLRDDGAVDRTKVRGTISHTLQPPPGVRYTQVTAGFTATYFLRSDGLVDRSTGYGKVQQTIRAPETALKENKNCGCIMM